MNGTITGLLAIIAGYIAAVAAVAAAYTIGVAMVHSKRKRKRGPRK